MNGMPDWVDGPGFLYRRAPLVVDDMDTARGQVHGVVVPYETRAELAPSIFEEFAPGAFAKQVNAPDAWGRIKLLIGHDQSKVPMGRATALTEARTGLEARFQVNMKMVQQTERGREAWLALESGDLDEFSVGFRSVTRGGTEVQRLRNGEVLLRRKHAHLGEVSLVPVGVYGSQAAVLSVRAEDRTQPPPAEVWADWKAQIASLRGSLPQ